MRICYLADGQSIHTKKWVRYFAENGFEVHLVTFGSADRVEGVEVHNLAYRSKLSYLSRILDVRKVVKEIDPDIMHAHFVSHYGMYAALTGFRPFVVTAWGSDVLIDPQESLIKRRIVKYVLGKADVITCDAEHMREAMTKLGAAPEKIELLFFGIDTRRFRPSEKNAELRTKLEIYDSPAIISLRSLKPLYDVESLIRSVPLILKEVPEAKFVIAGEGSEETRLKDLTRSLGISNNVKFIGLVPNDSLPQYLTSMDVYVSTSTSDAGIAASTAEAMACGLPVVITDVADNRKWVEDGTNGFVVPIKDPSLLAEKIVYLLENKEIKAEFGKRNREIIEKRNDYYKEMEKMARIYAELVERRKE